MMVFKQVFIKLSTRVWQSRYSLTVLLFLVFTVYLAPAKLLTSVLSSQVPVLLMSEGQGSFWQGSSQYASVSIDGSELPLGEVRWSLNPWSLLLLQPHIELQSQYPNQLLRANVSVSLWGDVTVSALKSEFDLAVLKPWVPVLFGGTVFISVEQLTLDLHSEQITDLDALINVRDSIWLGGDVAMPLGNYQGNISQVDNDITVAFSDQNANLAITGNAIIKTKGTYQLSLQLRERPQLHPAVMKTIAWLGKKQADGAVLINRNGHWK